MIQKCPQCSMLGITQWCKAIEEKAKDRASRELGEGTYNPFNWVSAGVEAMLGDKYKFCCPVCGFEWGTNNKEDDQTKEYQESCKHPQSNIKSQISDNPIENYRDIRGLIFLNGFYEEGLLKKPKQFKERFEELTYNYINKFWHISEQERRFIIVDKDLKYLPDSFLVLPIDNLPHNISFPTKYPHLQEIYVAHPYKCNEYIPYNDYQLSLFRDEIHEFAWIMQCLGAKSISFHEAHINEQKIEKRIDKETGGGASYKGYSAKGAYRRGETKDDYEKLTEELLQDKVFDITPNVLPFIPQDVVWYQHRSEWQRDCESRQAGRLLKASFRLSTNRITAASEQERKKIEADLQILLFKANGSHEQEENVSLRSEENHTWTVDVEFYPLSAYNTSDSNKVLLQNTQSATLTSKEEEYLAELKEILADGEISPRERRLLEKIRIQSGISEERAAELENSLTALKLTEEEQEYLDEYKDVIADGEITEKARRLLDKFRKLNGISEERAKEIEASVKR